MTLTHKVTWILKVFSTVDKILLPNLAVIFCIIIRKGSFPACWKIVNVTPIPKVSSAVTATKVYQAQCTCILFTGEQYYKKKLWTYNLGAHDSKSSQGFMSLWNETQRVRRAARVVSILQYKLMTRLLHKYIVIVFFLLTTFSWSQAFSFLFTAQW